MSNDKTAPRSPKNIPVKIRNPRYEGATPEMVGKVLLQRPPKAEKPVADEAKDDEDPSDG